MEHMRDCKTMLSKHPLARRCENWCHLLSFIHNPSHSSRRTSTTPSVFHSSTSTCHADTLFSSAPPTASPYLRSTLSFTFSTSTCGRQLRLTPNDNYKNTRRLDEYDGYSYNYSGSLNDHARSYEKSSYYREYHQHRPYECADQYSSHHGQYITQHDQSSHYSNESFYYYHDFDGDASVHRELKGEPTIVSTGTASLALVAVDRDGLTPPSRFSEEDRPPSKKYKAATPETATSARIVPLRSVVAKRKQPMYPPFEHESEVDLNTRLPSPCSPHAYPSAPYPYTSSSLSSLRKDVISRHQLKAGVNNTPPSSLLDHPSKAMSSSIRSRMTAPQVERNCEISSLAATQRTTSLSPSPTVFGGSPAPSRSMSPQPRRRGRQRQQELTEYLCPISGCDKRFDRRYNLNTHIITHDPERAHQFDCVYEGCGRRFTRKNDMHRHVKSVHLGERIECSACGAQFSRSDALRKHTCPRGQCFQAITTLGHPDSVLRSQAASAAARSVEARAAVAGHTQTERAAAVALTSALAAAVNAGKVTAMTTKTGTTTTFTIEARNISTSSNSYWDSIDNISSSGSCSDALYQEDEEAAAAAASVVLKAQGLSNEQAVAATSANGGEAGSDETTMATMSRSSEGTGTSAIMPSVDEMTNEEPSAVQTFDVEIANTETNTAPLSDIKEVGSEEESAAITSATNDKDGIGEPQRQQQEFHDREESAMPSPSPTPTPTLTLSAPGPLDDETTEGGDFLVDDGRSTIQNQFARQSAGARVKEQRISLTDSEKVLIRQLAQAGLRTYYATDVKK